MFSGEDAHGDDELAVVNVEHVKRISETFSPQRVKKKGVIPKSMVQEIWKNRLAPRFYSTMMNVMFPEDLREVSFLSFYTIYKNLAEPEAEIMFRALTIYHVATIHEPPFNYEQADEYPNAPFKNIKDYVCDVITSYLHAIIHINMKEALGWLELKASNSLIDGNLVAAYLLKDLETHRNEVSIGSLEIWLENNEIYYTVSEQLFLFVFGVNKTIDVKSLIPYPEVQTGKTSKTLLSLPDVLLLNSKLPKRAARWTLAYIMNSSNNDWETFKQVIYGKSQTLIVIQDSNGDIFGMYAAQRWYPSERFYGNDQCFLFTLKPDVNIYEGSGRDDNFQMFTDSGIGLGGTEANPGLFINWSLGVGTTSTRCITFDRFWPLSRDLVFDIRLLELWVVNEVLLKKRNAVSRDFYNTVVMWEKIEKNKKQLQQNSPMIVQQTYTNAPCPAGNCCPCNRSAVIDETERKYFQSSSTSLLQQSPYISPSSNSIANAPPEQAPVTQTINPNYPGERIVVRIDNNPNERKSMSPPYKATSAQYPPYISPSAHSQANAPPEPAPVTSPGESIVVRFGNNSNQHRSMSPQYKATSAQYSNKATNPQYSNRATIPQYNKSTTMSQPTFNPYETKYAQTSSSLGLCCPVQQSPKTSQTVQVLCPSAAVLDVCCKDSKLPSCSKTRPIKVCKCRFTKTNGSSKEKSRGNKGKDSKKQEKQRKKEEKERRNREKKEAKEREREEKKKKKKGKGKKDDLCTCCECNPADESKGKEDDICTSGEESSVDKRSKKKKKEKEEKKKKGKGNDICICCKCVPTNSPSEESCVDNRSKKKKEKKKKEKKEKSKERKKPKSSRKEKSRQKTEPISSKPCCCPQLQLPRPSPPGPCREDPVVCRRTPNEVKPRVNSSAMRPPNRGTGCCCPLNQPPNQSQVLNSPALCCCNQRPPAITSDDVCRIYNSLNCKPKSSSCDCFQTKSVCSCNCSRKLDNCVGNWKAMIQPTGASNNETNGSSQQGPFIRNENGSSEVPNPNITVSPALLVPNIEIGNGDSNGSNILRNITKSGVDLPFTRLPASYTSTGNLVINVSKQEENRGSKEWSSNQHFVPPCVLYLDCTKVKDICVIIRDKYEEPS